MKYFFEAIVFAYFVAALANSTVKPTKSSETKKAQCNLNYNTNFYAGPNCKKIERQLAEIKREILEEIRAMKRNETGGSGGKGLLLSSVDSCLSMLKTHKFLKLVVICFCFLLESLLIKSFLAKKKRDHFIVTVSKVFSSSCG